MNIAIIIPSLGGGGAEKVAKQLGDYYVEKGDNVYYFLLNSRIRDVYEVKGQKIKTGLESVTTGLKGGIKALMIRLIQASLVIRKLKAKYNIDVAISFMEECNYLNILSQRGEKVIVRICTILSQRNDLNRYLYNKRIISFFYSLSCIIVVMSDFAKRDLIETYGIKKQKVKIIYNAVNEDFCKEKGKIDSNKVQDNIVLSVGRLDPVKQQDRIIRAFSYVVSRIPDARLVIAGDGDNERYLRFVARKRRVDDNVEFVGFHKNIWNAYGNAKCFVMASKVEGFPNSMVEAMVCGIPIVSTNSPGGIQDILGKKEQICEGYYMCQYGIKTKCFPHSRAEADDELIDEEITFGRAIVRMLSDNEVSDRYSKMSQERANYFKQEKIFEEWNEIIG